MIRYDLKCEAGHAFDIWFADSAAFTDQRARNLVTCPLCGSTKVDKALMAPGLAKGSGSALAEAGPQGLAEKLRAYREHVLKQTEDVGRNFPDQARQMHYGEVEVKPIRGEASSEEARELLSEGVTILPVPPDPSKGN